VSSLLQVERLNVSFATQTGEVAAVRDVSFSIPESGTLGLVGESGSGKSATSLAIMRLLPPQARTSGDCLCRLCCARDCFRRAVFISTATL